MKLINLLKREASLTAVHFSELLDIKRMGGIPSALAYDFLVTCLDLARSYETAENPESNDRRNIYLPSQRS